MKFYCATFSGRRIYFEALSLDQAMLKARRYQPRKNWRRLKTVSEAWWYDPDLNGPLTEI